MRKLAAVLLALSLSLPSAGLAGSSGNEDWSERYESPLLSLLLLPVKVLTKITEPLRRNAEKKDEERRREAQGDD